MIKDNQRYLNRLHVVVDAVVTAASYLLGLVADVREPLCR